MLSWDVNNGVRLTTFSKILLKYILGDNKDKLMSVD